MLYICCNTKSLTILQPATCPPTPTVTVLVLCIYSNTRSNDGLTSHGGLTATVTKQPYLRHFYMCVCVRESGWEEWEEWGKGRLEMQDDNFMSRC